jgi:hypothetical protein
MPDENKDKKPAPKPNDPDYRPEIDVERRTPPERLPSEDKGATEKQT